MPVFRLVELHPVVVHFPIALLITSVVLDILAVFFRRARLMDAATWLLVFGVPSAGAALLAGVISERYVNTSSVDGLLHLHKVLAVLTSLLFGVLLLVRLAWLAPRILAWTSNAAPALTGSISVAEQKIKLALPGLYAPRTPPLAVTLYLALSLVGVGLLAATGYLGGAIVYDHSVGPTSLILHAQTFIRADPPIHSPT